MARKRVIDLTIGDVSFCAGDVIAVVKESDDTGTLVFDKGAEINTGISRDRVLRLLMEFGYATMDFDELEDG